MLWFGFCCCCLCFGIYILFACLNERVIQTGTDKTTLVQSSILSKDEQTGQIAKSYDGYEKSP